MLLALGSDRGSCSSSRLLLWIIFLLIAGLSFFVGVCEAAPELTGIECYFCMEASCNTKGGQTTTCPGKSAKCSTKTEKSSGRLIKKDCVAGVMEKVGCDDSDPKVKTCYCDKDLCNDQVGGTGSQVKPNSWTYLSWIGTGTYVFYFRSCD